MNTVLWIIIAILVIAFLFKNVIKEIWGYIVRNRLFFGKDDYKEGGYEEMPDPRKEFERYNEPYDYTKLDMHEEYDDGDMDNPFK